MSPTAPLTRTASLGLPPGSPRWVDLTATGTIPIGVNDTDNTPALLDLDAHGSLLFVGPGGRGKTSAAHLIALAAAAHPDRYLLDVVCTVPGEYRWITGYGHRIHPPTATSDILGRVLADLDHRERRPDADTLPRRLLILDSLGAAATSAPPDVAATIHSQLDQLSRRAHAGRTTLLIVERRHQWPIYSPQLVHDSHTIVFGDLDTDPSQTLGFTPIPVEDPHTLPSPGRAQHTTADGTVQLLHTTSTRGINWTLTDPYRDLVDTWATWPALTRTPDADRAVTGLSPAETLLNLAAHLGIDLTGDTGAAARWLREAWALADAEHLTRHHPPVEVLHDLCDGTLVWALAERRTHVEPRDFELAVTAGTLHWQWQITPHLAPGLRTLDAILTGLPGALDPA